MFLLGIIAVTIAGSKFARADAGAPAVHGTIAARSLVGSISAENSAIVESKPPKPVPTLGASSTLPILGSSLATQFEGAAGSDRVVALADTPKQASIYAVGRMRVNSFLQMGGSFALRTQGDDNGMDMAAQLLIGPTLNIGDQHEGHENMWFFTPKVGLTIEHATGTAWELDSKARPTFALMVGKRIALAKNIVSAPSVGVITQAHYAPTFIVMPIALSMYF